MGMIQFGISLVPTERLDRIRELTRAADRAGLDLVGIQDHPYQRHFLDTWSLIPTLLAVTERISLFTDVANLPAAATRRDGEGRRLARHAQRRPACAPATKLIDAAAEKAGRDPASIRRIINLQGLIGEAPAPSRSELPVGYLAGEPLAGSAAWWVETLAGLVDDGFDTLVFWPVDMVPEQVELLAHEVVPQLPRA